MNKIHHYLMQKSSWYARWHRSPLHIVSHWSVFFLISLSLLIFINSYVKQYFQASADIETAANNQSQVKEKTKKTAFKNQILVKFKPVAQEKADQVIKKHSLTEKEQIEKIKVKIFTVPIGQDPNAVAEKLNNEKETVEFAEIDALVAPAFIPNDPLYPNQWHHSKINSPLAWDNVTGSNVTVGIADTGVDAAHPDLAADIVPGWNFYDNNSDTRDVHGHGTQVAGTVGTVGNNSRQVAGIAYSAKIMPLRISDPTGWASWSRLAQAITYAADNNVKVVNVSYQASSSATVQSAAQYLYSKGGLAVIAAGNDGANLQIPNPYEIITVSATDSSDKKASWSNYGSIIDVAAPGVAILTTNKGGGTGTASGTSLSSPAAAGVLALIYSVNPSFSAAKAMSILYDSSLDLGLAGRDDIYGWGRVQAGQAVQLALNPPGDSTPPTTPQNLTAIADYSEVKLNWSASTDNVNVAGYKIFRDGSEIASTSLTNYTDRSVVIETTYIYTVKAFDDESNLSPSSNAVTVTIPKPSLQITQSSVVTTATQATINVTTNIPSLVTVKYGPSQSSLNTQVTDNLTSTSHSITITNLASQTRYYYQIIAISANDSTDQTTSSVSQFRTKKR